MADLEDKLVGPVIPPTPRETDALTPHWKSHIRPEDHRMFLWMEGMYTLPYERKFYNCNNNEKKSCDYKY